MSTVKRQVEITVNLSNEPALMGRLMATAGSCGAEVLAACSYYSYDGAVVMLVTDDADRTLRALEDAGFKCKRDSVLLVEIPDEPGIAAVLGARLSAARIRVLYSYSFRSENNHGYMVFKTTDDYRAFYLLEVESLVHELAAAKSWRRALVSQFEEQHALPEAA
jgi:hypothetical protein